MYCNKYIIQLYFEFSINSLRQKAVSKRVKDVLHYLFSLCRSLQHAELSRSVIDPELFSHGAYDKFFVTLATKMPYLTFYDKLRHFLI